MRLAVIPARGGSKRIPRKNIKLFCGKPIIAWPLQAVIESNCFDRIIVSTDDEEIAEVAQKYGAEVPFTRPARLSDDFTGTTPVVAHAITWQNKHALTCDEVCCVYPTSPFLLAKDLQNGLKVLLEARADFAFSVTSYPFPIQRAFRITKDSRVEMFQPEFFHFRSQDLEKGWHDAGQFYWGLARAWLEEKPVFSASSVLPRYRVQDIDGLRIGIEPNGCLKPYGSLTVTIKKVNQKI